MDKPPMHKSTTAFDFLNGPPSPLFPLLPRKDNNGENTLTVTVEEMGDPPSLSFFFHCPLGICHNNGFVTHKRHKNGTRKEGGDRVPRRGRGRRTYHSEHGITWHGMIVVQWMNPMLGSLK